MATDGVQQQQNMPSMGTDELVHYLDNEVVAFVSLDDDPQSNVMEQVHDYAVGNPQAY
ncbi:hypothetical protein V1508DRAFT_400850 [Lipomyces doorenjongii]|uniref:uncharacterized protein n=1 Tax=Lipomyces doorenjongii TaxID=383834 RepID=UPI0034CDBAA8